MECNKDEAIRAREIAERKMQSHDFAGAKRFAFKAQQLYANLDNIPMMVAVCEVHCSVQNKIVGHGVNWYDVLQVDRTADETAIKKQYRKLALLLHPDKNKFSGAEAAFKLIGEANRVLSNKMTRSVFDMQVKASKQTSTYVKPPFRPSTGSSSVNKQPNSEDRNCQPKYHTFQQGVDKFWTRCPYCKTSYEYFRLVVGKQLSCQNCRATFIANETKAPVSRSNANVNQAECFRGKGSISSPTGPESAGKGAETNQKSNGHSVRNSTRAPPTKAGVSVNDSKKKSKVPTKAGLAVDNSKQKRNDAGGVKSDGQQKDSKSEVEKPGMPKAPRNASKKRGRPGVIDSSLSSDGVGDADASTEVNQENYSIKNNAEVEKLKHSTGTSCMENVSISRKLKKQADNIQEGKVEVVKENGVDSNIAPEFFDCLDSEFYDFDKDKEKSCFKVDQIWAAYDTDDAMPRFYARITEVYAPDYKLQITWLKPEKCRDSNTKWIDEELPIACGMFGDDEIEDTTDFLMFSHQIHFERGKKVCSYLIYPRCGEIWALFRNWDIGWVNDPEKHKPYKYDFVVVLSDFNQKDGIEVAYLKKLKGFVSLFQKTTRDGRSSFQIPPCNLFQFSHRVPHFQLSGNERDDVPSGSYELDTASLPNEFDELEDFTERMMVTEKKEAANDASCKRSTSINHELRAVSGLVETGGSRKKSRLDDASQGPTNLKKDLPKEVQNNHESGIGTSNQHNEVAPRNPTTVVRRSPRVSLTKNNKPIIT